MSFGYKPKISFCYFFCTLDWVIFQVRVSSKRIDSISSYSWHLAGASLSHGLVSNFCLCVFITISKHLLVNLNETHSKRLLETKGIPVQ